MKTQNIEKWLEELMGDKLYQGKKIEFAVTHIKDKIRNEWGNKIGKLKEMHEINRDATLVGRYEKSEPYFVGLYNGMEYAVAMMEERNPVFEDIKRLTLWQKIHKWYMEKVWKPQTTAEQITGSNEKSLLTSQKDSFIRKVENMKEDDRPEITKWLISEDYTKGYNRAIDDILAKLKELK